MPIRFFTLILLSLLVALSTNSARACGSRVGEKSCCAAKALKKQATCTKSNRCEHQQAGHKCADQAGHGGCHCPCAVVSGGPVSAAIEEFPPFLSFLSASEDATLRQAFYYAQHLPEAVYLAIWEPPQL